MTTKMAALAALALICAAPASAQPGPDDPYRRGGWQGGRGGEITLYPSLGFRGQGFSATREFTNLPRQFNDGAMSLRVRGGAWEVCADANFRGRCQVVTRNVGDLREIGLSGAISSLRPVDGGQWGGGGYPGPGGGWGGGGGPRGGATLFDGPDFTGRSFSTMQEFSNLPRENNDRALSLRVERGAWEVCTDANFRGRCQVFRRDVPDLRAFGFGEAISSLRPAPY